MSFFPARVRYDCRRQQVISKPETWCLFLVFRQQADQDSYSAPIEIARLWVHECERVFRDRIISAPEMEVLDGMMGETAKKHLSEFQVQTYVPETRPYSTSCLMC